MATPLDAPSARLSQMWKRLAPLPGGTWLFSRLLGIMVPYTGSLGAHIRALEPGYARVELRDRRAVRNHLRSIHAVALANLAEVTTGLAVLIGLPPGVRGILVGLTIEYTKKARGTLTAEATVTIPVVHEPMDYLVHADIRDAAGDPVARIAVQWRLSPPQA